MSTIQDFLVASAALMTAHFSNQGLTCNRVVISMAAFTVVTCSLLHAGAQSTGHYPLAGSFLPICNTTSDVGVDFDNLLSFKTHTQYGF